MKHTKNKLGETMNKLGETILAYLVLIVLSCRKAFPGCPATTFSKT